MSTVELEQRVMALESKYAAIMQMIQSQPPKGAWRKVVGMFANDPHIGELHEEMRRIREADRQATRNCSEGES
jgi:hypothetical protein